MFFSFISLKVMISFRIFSQCRFSGKSRVVAVPPSSSPWSRCPLSVLFVTQPLRGRDQWFARDMCGSATFFPILFFGKEFLASCGRLFPFRASVLNAGPFPVFSFVLLFALPSLGLADEKDFLFVFPLLSLSYRSSGGVIQ